MPAASLDDLDWIENGQVFRHEGRVPAVGGKRSREALSREPRRDAISHDIQEAVLEHFLEHSRVSPEQGRVISVPLFATAGRTPAFLVVRERL